MKDTGWPAGLVFLGTLEVLYKAPDVLIDAVAQCIREGLDLRLTMIGDGAHRSDMEARAEARGIGSRVAFVGQLLSGAAVRDELDKADLFILPSHCEGLPRAMIEAMARALPCIGSAVGGIPELLPVEDMFRPGSVDELARKITEVVTSPQRMAEMSARNLEKANNYRDSVLRERRLEFDRYVEQKTLESIKQRES
jgi:glycosyltransferase involved in cell wall biosynthesis